MQLEERKLMDIFPYENNPRKNDEAVDAVAESIKQCGYIAPIILDENGVILAGHTRYKALQKLGYEKANVIVVKGLSEEQKRKYRILDNKTSELAGWDYDLLAEELKGLDFDDFDFGLNVDLGDDIDIDGIFTEVEPTPKEPKKHTCPYCGGVFEE